MPIAKEVVIYASAARTAAPTLVDQDNIDGHRGAIIFIDCTASAATPSVVFTVQGKEPFGDEYYDILASAAVTGASNTVLRVYPGLAAVANQTIADVLPRTWRVTPVHADTDSITYSVSAVLLP